MPGLASVSRQSLGRFPRDRVRGSSAATSIQCTTVSPCLCDRLSIHASTRSERRVHGPIPVTPLSRHRQARR